MPRLSYSLNVNNNVFINLDEHLLVAGLHSQNVKEHKSKNNEGLEDQQIEHKKIIELFMRIIKVTSFHGEVKLAPIFMTSMPLADFYGNHKIF